jgi:ubiquinone/menaquinone biosynthesis C-methylase UbiE
MVNVQRQAPVALARDETALDIFRHQWELYRKFLTHDYLENAGAYAELHRFLNDNVTRPFAFVDLACGDASGIVTALKGTEIANYRGIDLAPPALELAKRNLAALPCAVELDEADFVQAMRTGSGPADVVWISLSLHHLTTPDKCTLMREIQAQLSPNGALLIYEPTCRDGESRADYLDRFEETGRREWTALSAEEFEEAMRHVRTCDLPETVTKWGTLGHDAGFTRIAELYKAPSDLFRLFSYRA